MKVLPKPTARMMLAACQNRASILRALDRATPDIMVDDAAIVLLHGSFANLEEDDEVGDDLWIELDGDWKIIASPRSGFLSAVPWLEKYAAAVRGTLVVMLDDVGTQKGAVCSVEDIGLCRCQQGNGPLNDRAVLWLTEALFRYWPTIKTSLPKPTDAAEIVVHVEWTEVSTDEEIPPEIEGIFDIEVDFVPRTDEILRLASHPEDCPSLRALTTHPEGSLIVRARRDGVETWFACARGTWEPE